MEKTSHSSPIAINCCNLVTVLKSFCSTSGYVKGDKTLADFPAESENLIDDALLDHTPITYYLDCVAGKDMLSEGKIA